MSQQTSIPPSPPQKKPIGKGVIVTVLAVVIVAIVLIAFVLIPLINRPQPEITLVNGYESFQGLNYVYKVDVNVKNNGADGWVRVYAEISGAGRYEKQDHRTYLARGESESLQFVFDISLWGALTNPTITYRAWAVVD